MRIYLDSNVLIAALSPYETHSTAAQKLVRQIAEGHFTAAASSMVYGEVLDMSSSKKLDVHDFLTHITHFSTIPADDAICMRAGLLRQKYGSKLKLPDALHLATAVVCKADMFITDDAALAKVSQQIIETKTLGRL